MNGASRRPATFPGGHHSGPSLTAPGAAAPRPEVYRPVRGQEGGPELGSKRLVLEVGVNARGDRRRRHVGLLGGEPTLLDRKPAGIADGVHVGAPCHPHSRVGGDQAVWSLRHPVQWGNLEPR